jgi:hypothetical protein
MQFIPSMIATIVFYFIAAPMLRRLRGFEPFRLRRFIAVAPRC